MIIGKGMLAQHFQPYDCDATILCSGVADSSSLNFEREARLILSIPAKQYVVYTSTIQAELNKTSYQAHKLHMERLIMERFPNFLILKVGNLVSKTGQNNKQFFPSIVGQIKQKHVNILDCKRDLLTAPEYVKIVHSLITAKKTGILKICQPSPPKVLDIVAELEDYLGAANKTIIPWDEPDIYQADIIPDANYQSVIRWYFD